MLRLLDRLAVFVHLDNWRAVRRYGPGVVLRWRGMAGGDVVRLLRAYGVTTYAPGMPAKNERSIRVPASQARWAEYVCKRAGVPLVGPTIDASNAGVTVGPMPPAWGVAAKPVGLAGRIFAALGSGRQPQIVTAARRLVRR